MLLLYLSLLAAVAASGAPQPVILIADVGVDDAAALLWALGTPSLEIVGIAASFGCHRDVIITARNAQLLIAAANRSHVPVYLGSRYPLGQASQLDLDGSAYHGDDGFGSVFEGELDARAQAEMIERYSAAEFIANTARSRPGEVAVLCFSPLTNVALAALIEPRLPTLLKALVVMGGALHVPGNVSPLAEANFAHDAVAAHLVVQGFGAPTATCSFVLAPLDVTTRSSALLKASVVEGLRASGGRAAQLFARAHDFYSGVYCKRNGMCDGTAMHDAHTVGWMVAPHLYERNVSEFEVDVIVAPGTPSHGMLLTDRRRSSSGQPTKAKVRVMLDVDGQAFVAQLASAIDNLRDMDDLLVAAHPVLQASVGAANGAVEVLEMA